MIPNDASVAKPRFTDLLRRVHLTTEDHVDPKIRELAAEGKAHIPAGFGLPWDVESAPPVSGDYVGALKALLDEREASGV